MHGFFIDWVIPWKFKCTGASQELYMWQEMLLIKSSSTDLINPQKLNAHECKWIINYLLYLIPKLNIFSFKNVL